MNGLQMIQNPLNLFQLKGVKVPNLISTLRPYNRPLMFSPQIYDTVLSNNIFVQSS